VSRKKPWERCAGPQGFWKATWEKLLQPTRVNNVVARYDLATDPLMAARNGAKDITHMLGMMPIQGKIFTANIASDSVSVEEAGAMPEMAYHPDSSREGPTKASTMYRRKRSRRAAFARGGVRTSRRPDVSVIERRGVTEKSQSDDSSRYQTLETAESSRFDGKWC